MERMKRVVCVLLCLVLVFSMLPMSALAASGRGNGRGNSGKGNNGKGNGRWGSTTSTEPTESAASDTQLLAVENETTVENADMLRASTYVLTSSNDVAEAVEDGTYDIETLAEDGNSTVLKYFNVTMYNYDEYTINEATDELDNDLAVREGLYFSDGAPSYTKEETSIDTLSYTVEDGQIIIENGTYLIYCTSTGYYVTDYINSSSPWGTTVLNGTYYGYYEDASEWTFTRQEDGSYCIQDAEGRYLTITGLNSATTTAEKNTVTLAVSNQANGTFTIYDDAGSGNGYMNSLGENTYGMGYFGGYSSGSVFCLQITSDEESIVDGYEAWNRWDKATGENENGQKTWTGLVEPTLNANKDIVFTVPEGGIFNSDATVKDIYTNVQMPFVYENGTYTFDASQHGVYFLADETQGSTAVGSNSRLYFDEDTPQGWYGMESGDGSTNLWAPFNNNDNDYAESAIDYHFGMRTTIPFSMTANGRMNPNDPNSDAIKFSFSGDDDVWVFIDGQLVIDLGGIHNRLDAEINFAENTITYSESNVKDYPTGSYNDPDFELIQTLFGGVIAQDRATFAATDSHELTIFYLERGKGSSNCKIQFNLPMKDTVTVTKHATKSWNEENEEEDNLTDDEQAIVNNMDFGFTLFKSTDGGATYSRVANTSYSLLNENGQVISVPSTDSNGHFTLKNGQSARFVTSFTNNDNKGVTYYVVEDDVSGLGFVTPDFSFDGDSANGFKANELSYTKGSDIPEQEIAMGATSNTSYAVTVYGSDEYEDSVVFICDNFLDAKLPNPSARPVEDRIVIDYGLPVVIDILKNDLFRGNEVEIIGVYGDGVTLKDEAKVTVYDTELAIDQIVSGTTAPVYGTAVIDNNKITYQLTEQLTGVEVLNYVIKVTGSVTTEVSGTKTAYAYGIAQVYIMPATTMYYEENFASLITYTNDGGAAWRKDLITESTYISPNQEPGVVGTVGDSPYGSDVAYLNDSHDSNGTSKYASTTTKAAKFEYTFTGTGSSIYARTGANTGMMRIIVVNTATGDVEHDGYRNTKYVTGENSSDIGADTLYNIPVYSTGNLGFGTYHVTVVIGRGTDDNGYGTDFWLDGIRVYQPLYAADANYDKATSAYATDGEANMANETLRDKILIEADYVENDNGVMVPVWTQDGNFVLLTDINGEMLTAEEYQTIGPKEEVYLYNGQTVSFSLYDWDPNTNKIYLGIKAPTGSGTVTIGGTTLEIKNATDCYYDISSYATITTDSDGIKTATFTITSGSGSLISLTNIKVSGQFEFTIISGSVEEEG